MATDFDGHNGIEVSPEGGPEIEVGLARPHGVLAGPNGAIQILPTPSR